MSNTPSEQSFSIITTTFKVITAGFVGSIVGMIIGVSVISGYALIILTPVFNIYYALIFFIIGSVYTCKLFQKNKI